MEKGIIQQKTDKEFYVLFSKKIYNKVALLSAAYVFEKNIKFLFEDQEEAIVAIAHTGDRITSDKAKNLLLAFCNEALEQELKLEIREETAQIRKTIYEKAFFAPQNRNEE